MSDKILNQINNYYSDKIIKNGPTPQGVDWNSIESQVLRFKILSEVITEKNNFSVLDYGCGFGSMYDFLKAEYNSIKFSGFDISNQMISEARKRNENDTNAEWFTILPADKKADYVIASGIFNVKLEHSEEEWQKYIIKTLTEINQIATKGFSFNILTKYSDQHYMKEYLYYADPLFLFDYCKKTFSKFVCLKHDYPLYEFSIIVRK
ncbi:MAG: class I SAM-dependent methyltransferase [Bacteroidota bacterium]